MHIFILLRLQYIFTMTDKKVMNENENIVCVCLFGRNVQPSMHNPYLQGIGTVISSFIKIWPEPWKLRMYIDRVSVSAVWSKRKIEIDKLWLILDDINSRSQRIDIRSMPNWIEEFRIKDSPFFPDCLPTVARFDALWDPSVKNVVFRDIDTFLDPIDYENEVQFLKKHINLNGLDDHDDLDDRDEIKVGMKMGMEMKIHAYNFHNQSHRFMAGMISIANKEVNKLNFESALKWLKNRGEYSYGVDQDWLEYIFQNVTEIHTTKLNHFFNDTTNSWTTKSGKFIFSTYNCRPVGKQIFKVLYKNLSTI